MSLRSRFAQVTGLLLILLVSVACRESEQNSGLHSPDINSNTLGLDENRRVEGMLHPAAFQAQVVVMSGMAAAKFPAMMVSQNHVIVDAQVLNTSGMGAGLGTNTAVFSPYAVMQASQQPDLLVEAVEVLNTLGVAVLRVRPTVFNPDGFLAPPEFLTLSALQRAGGVSCFTAGINAAWQAYVHSGALSVDSAGRVLCSQMIGFNDYALGMDGSTKAGVYRSTDGAIVGFHRLAQPLIVPFYRIFEESLRQPTRFLEPVFDFGGDNLASLSERDYYEANPFLANQADHHNAGGAKSIAVRLLRAGATTSASRSGVGVPPRSNGSQNGGFNLQIMFHQPTMLAVVCRWGDLIRRVEDCRPDPLNPYNPDVQLLVPGPSYGNMAEFRSNPRTPLTVNDRSRYAIVGFSGPGGSPTTATSARLIGFIPGAYESTYPDLDQRPPGIGDDLRGQDPDRRDSRDSTRDPGLGGPSEIPNPRP